MPRGGASPCLAMSAAGAKSWARSQVCDPCQRGRDLESNAELLLSERWTEILSKTTECALFLPMPTCLLSSQSMWEATGWICYGAGGLCAPQAHLHHGASSGCLVGLFLCNFVLLWVFFPLLTLLLVLLDLPHPCCC